MSHAAMLPDTDTDEDARVSAQLLLELAQCLEPEVGLSGSSPLYHLLPTEIRHHIYSYVVVKSGPIHVHAPHDNYNHGFRLALCGEDMIEQDWGRCRCRNGSNSNVMVDYLDTALLLVSRSVRREVADILFSRNRFAFTDLSDVLKFSHVFKTSSSRIQSMMIYDRADDYECQKYRQKSVSEARKRLSSLQHLKIFLYLNDWTCYEQVYEDGFLDEISPFNVLPISQFEGYVRWFGSLGSSRNGCNAAMAKRVEEKLNKIFTGFYDGQEIPRAPRPPRMIREEEMPLLNRKGIIALPD